MLPAPERPAQGWHNSSHFIFQSVVDQTQAVKGIEIGCWHGASTIEIAKAMQSIAKPNSVPSLVCIDTWLGALEFYTTPTPERNLQKEMGYPQVYFQFLSNCVDNDVIDIIEPLPLPSKTAAQVLNAKEMTDFDFVYIDGSHEYEDVKSDILQYYDMLRPGGIMFGDDYTNGAFPGVADAVNELFFHEQIEVVDNWFWLVKKPE